MNNLIERTERMEQTLPLAELVGQVEQLPAPPIDLDEVGERYAREARLKTAMDRWCHFCPPELQETDWEHVKMKPYNAQQRVIMAWKGGKRGVLAAGPTARGKSRSAWALMKRLSEEGRECRFFTAASFFAALQSQVSYGRDTAYDWLVYLSKIPIVFIDDLGQEAVQANKMEWAQGWLLQLCDLRVGLGLPFFVTTNLSAREMTDPTQQIRADPLIRRLLDLCDVVKFWDEPAR